MDIKSKDFQVPEGDKVRLKKWPTMAKQAVPDLKEYEERLAQSVQDLSGLQQLLYASGKQSLLVVFQGMDTAGKDGAIGHLLTGVNPEGCEVFSFKSPSAGELAHDFLWRAVCRLPSRGRIGIFNRSYYEDVLIVRVHPQMLAAGSMMDPTEDAQKVWKGRYRSIVEFERHLHRNGTRVVKIFLHISKEEQKQRLLARIDDPSKNWKIGDADIAERADWAQYAQAYDHCLTETTSDAAPWYIVPADDKHSARLIVSQIVVDALRGMDLAAPQVDKARQKELALVRSRLAAQA